MRAVSASAATIENTLKDPGVALTTLGVTEPNKEASI